MTIFEYFSTLKNLKSVSYLYLEDTTNCFSVLVIFEEVK